MCVLKDYSCIQNSIPFTEVGKEETSLSNTQYLSKIQKCIQLYSKAAAVSIFLSPIHMHCDRYFRNTDGFLRHCISPCCRRAVVRLLTLSIHSHFVKPVILQKRDSPEGHVVRMRRITEDPHQKSLSSMMFERKKYYLGVLALLLMYLLYPITHGLLRVSRMSTIKCSPLLMLHLGLIFCIVILCLRIASEAAAAALKYSSRSSLGCWERSERISLGIL